MRVHVDEPRRNNQPGSINRFVGVCRIQFSNRDDLSIANANIAMRSRRARAIDKLKRAGTRMSEMADAASRDAINRSRGLVAQVRGRLVRGATRVRPIVPPVPNVRADSSSVTAPDRTMASWGRTRKRSPPAVTSGRETRWLLLCSGREFPLQPGDNILGRTGEGIIALDAPSVSRQHARVTIAFDDHTTGSFGPIRPVAIRAVLEDWLAEGDEVDRRIGKHLAVVGVPTVNSKRVRQLVEFLLVTDLPCRLQRSLKARTRVRQLLLGQVDHGQLRLVCHLVPDAELDHSVRERAIGIQGIGVIHRADKDRHLLARSESASELPGQPPTHSRSNYRGTRHEVEIVYNGLPGLALDAEALLRSPADASLRAEHRREAALKRSALPSLQAPLETAEIPSLPRS